MKTIGLIGLGLMGDALARRALKAGYTVVGFDVRPARRSALARCGVRIADSANTVALRCREIVFSLPTTAIAKKVIKEIEGSFRKDALLIDTTTGDPAATAQLGTRLRARRIGYVDATIAANSTQTLDGRALVLIGGTIGDMQRSRRFLNCFAREILHCGPCGSGARMKLVYNMVLGLNRAVLAEGLAFAQKIGVDSSNALKVLKRGYTYSRVMDIKGERMLAGNFEPEARLSQHLKDVRMILDIARRHDARIPFSAVHRRLLAQLETAGDGELDNCAIIKAFH
jgi:3-hydroxyisobutyrate dehydrogenase-like beta-hydroxyacid dehydrogenase